MGTGAFSSHRGCQINDAIQENGNEQEIRKVGRLWWPVEASHHEERRTSAKAQQTCQGQEIREGDANDGDSR